MHGYRILSCIKIGRNVVYPQLYASPGLHGGFSIVKVIGYNLLRPMGLSVPDNQELAVNVDIGSTCRHNTQPGMSDTCGQCNLAHEIGITTGIGTYPLSSVWSLV